MRKIMRKILICLLCVVMMSSTMLTSVSAQEFRPDVNTIYKPEIIRDGNEIKIFIHTDQADLTQFNFGLVYDNNCLEKTNCSWSSEFLDSYYDKQGAVADCVNLDNAVIFIGINSEQFLWTGSIFEVTLHVKSDQAGKLMLVNHAMDYNGDFSNAEEKADTLVIDLNNMSIVDKPITDPGTDDNDGNDTESDTWTLKDAQLALRAVLQIEELSGLQLEKLDINRNRRMDLLDVQLLLKGALKIITDMDQLKWEYDSIDMLKVYINTLGQTDLLGNKYIGLYNDKNNFLYTITNESNDIMEFRIDFVSIIQGIEVRYAVYFQYDTNHLVAVDNKIYFDYDCESLGISYFTSADFKTAEYNDHINLYFKLLDGGEVPISSFQELANNCVQIGFASWDLLVFLKCRMNLSELGFRSYK